MPHRHRANHKAGASMSDVTSARMDEIFEKVKNWGRWGAEDQAGALNLITPQKRAAAAKAGAHRRDRLLRARAARARRTPRTRRPRST